jgi:hypothetical protein
MKRNTKNVRGRTRNKRKTMVRHLSSDGYESHHSMGNSAKIISIEAHCVSKFCGTDSSYGNKTASRCQKIKNKKYNLEIECKNVGLLL